MLNTKLVRNFMTIALAQNSAIVLIPTESYAIFSPVLAAVQTAGQNDGNEIFRAIEHQNLLMR